MASHLRLFTPLLLTLLLSVVGCRSTDGQTSVKLAANGSNGNQSQVFFTTESTRILKAILITAIVILVAALVLFVAILYLSGGNKDTPVYEGSENRVSRDHINSRLNSKIRKKTGREMGENSTSEKEKKKSTDTNRQKASLGK